MDRCRIAGKLLGLLGAWFVAVATAQAQSVLYVDGDAPPGGDGFTWTTPHNNLQTAITHAGTLGGVAMEIHVAGGVYRPAATGGARSALFILRNGVAIRGGYAGFGAANPDEQDVVQYPSILCGDLNGDDGPDFSNISDNSYHVVGGGSVDATAVLEGFTITAGHANGANPDDRGAGIILYPFANSPTFRRCTITANRASGKGGGMYAYQSSAAFRECAFRDNYGAIGGGVYLLQSSPHFFRGEFRGNAASGLGGGAYNFGSNAVFTDCVIEDNSALGGGGMHNFNSNPLLTNCVFRRNAAAQTANPAGGGMLCEPGSPTLINCVFSGNSAEMRGGGLYANLASQPQLRRCVFSGNHAAIGGGVAVAGGTTTLSDSILWGNSDNGGSGEASQIRIFGGAAIVDYCCVQALTGALDGVGNLGGDPRFIDADGSDGVYGTADDDVRISSSSPCINAGDPDFVNDPPQTDLDQHARVLCGRVDIGAYEFGIGDYDCDRTVNLADWAAWPACRTGPQGGPYNDGCAAFDFAVESGNSIDLQDFAGFQRIYAAP